jgi:phospholipase/carboxylesterase
MHDLFGLKPYLPPMNILCFQAPKNIGMGGFAWYDINWDNGNKIIDAEEVHSAARLVEESIALWKEVYNIDGPVVCGGFSQGAILSMAILKGEYEASGYVLMSGYMLPEWRNADWNISAPVLQTHGTMDHVIPYEWAESGARLLEHKDFEFKSYPMAHNLNAECIEDVNRFLQQF